MTLLDGRGGPPVADASVEVRGGRILYAGPDRRPPRGSSEIDGRGRFLLPGFIDMHAHLLAPTCETGPNGAAVFDRPTSEKMMGALLDFGVTTVRSPATPTVEGLRLRDDLNAGRVRGPFAHASAEFINDSSLDEAGLRRIVREALPHRPDYIKAYGALSPEAVAVLAQEAAAHGLPLIGHLGRTSWLEGVRLGVDHLTHAVDWSTKTLPADARESFAAASRGRGGLLYRIDWLEHVRVDAPEMIATVDAIAAAGVSLDPTLVAYDTKFSPRDNPRYRRNPHVDRVPELHAIWRRCGDNQTANWTEADFARWRAAWPKLQALVRLYKERGVLLTTGSDVSNPWVIPGESLHQEFELLVEAGLPPATVLRMTGENAARALPNPDVGVVAAGRRADLVLLTADPLQDIRNTRSIEWVMQRGRIVSRGPTASRQAS